MSLKQCFALQYYETCMTEVANACNTRKHLIEKAVECTVVQCKVL